MKYLLKYKIFESQELLKYFKVGMEFHNSEGKLVGKVTNVPTMTSNFCTSCGEKIKKPESKFCTNCGKEIKEIKFDNNSKKHIKYSNLVDGNEYEFNVKDFYDKLIAAGWNPNKEQINNTEKKDETPSDTKVDSKPKDSKFDELCNDYSKMKGANSDQLELIKKMAKSEKDESMKLAMIRRLIDNLKD